MGANAAVKCLQVVDQVERILAIELMSACQALEFRRPKRSSERVEELFAAFRKEVPFVDQDALMHELMEKALAFFRSS